MGVCILSGTLNFETIRSQFLRNVRETTLHSRTGKPSTLRKDHLLFTPTGVEQDDLSVDCAGTADGEAYARLGRCLEAPTFNIFSNNNR